MYPLWLRDQCGSNKQIYGNQTMPSQVHEQTVKSAVRRDLLNLGDQGQLHSQVGSEKEALTAMPVL